MAKSRKITGAKFIVSFDDGTESVQDFGEYRNYTSTTIIEKVEDKQRDVTTIQAFGMWKDAVD